MKSAAIIWLIGVVLVFIGYVLNIIALVGAASFGILELARVIGLIVFPVGALLGYFF